MEKRSLRRSRDWVRLENTHLLWFWEVSAHRGCAVIARKFSSLQFTFDVSCNVATSIKLLNVALLRAMDPGEWKKWRVVCKGPEFRSVSDQKNTQHNSLMKEERIPGGPGRTTEPPVEPRTECHQDFPASALSLSWERAIVRQ